MESEWISAGLAGTVALFFSEDPLLPLCKMSALDRGRPSHLAGDPGLADQNIPPPQPPGPVIALEMTI